MKRILLSKAIKDESIYMINNNSKIFSQPYYNSINGVLVITENVVNMVKNRKIEWIELLKSRSI